MKTRAYTLKFQPIMNRLFLKKETGVVLLVTLLLMLGIAVLGAGVIVNANLNASVAKNYIGKLQSFYAADAQVALLAQEIYDGNADKYLNGSSSCSGGGNIIQNCDFSGSTPWYSISQACGACNWACGGCSFTYGTVNGKRMGHLTVSNGGDSVFSAEVGQDNLTLQQDTTYRVSFSISTPESLDFADVNMQGMDDPWPLFTGNHYFYPGARAATISYDFKMDSATTSRGSIWFQCGGEGPLDLWLDDVSVKPISDSNYNLARCAGVSVWATGYETSPTAHPPGDAIDGNGMTTRWGSRFPGGTPNVTAAVADTEWISVNLGKTRMVNEVLLKWEAAFGLQYEIDVSADNVAWYQVAQVTDGKRESRAITFSPQDVQYVRMKGIKRGTSYGYSIYEFEVYGSKGGRDAKGKTYLGGDTVFWELNEKIPYAGFTIYDTAVNYFAGSKRTYRSQLSQYVELPTGGLVNPYGAIAYVHDTLWDFHSDRTNPEFEQPNMGGSGLSKGMVQTALVNGKPARNSEGEINHNIGKWFTQNGKVSVKIPKYPYRRFYNNFANDGLEFSVINNYEGSDSTAYNDSMFYNIRFIDSLSFTHIGNGMYEYTNDNFFPLDNSGFYTIDYLKNSAGLDHNYSFTMQIHTTFTKVAGQMFYFSGDDDVWVFINNNLVMDLGGIHSRASASFLVDTISGLATGQTYPFDFFYCERHSLEAHCKIRTNLLTYHGFTQKRVQWKRSYGNIN